MAELSGAYLLAPESMPLIQVECIHYVTYVLPLQVRDRTLIHTLWSFDTAAASVCKGPQSLQGYTCTLIGSSSSSLD